MDAKTSVFVICVETVIYLKRTNFGMYLFLQAKKILFRKYLFLRMASF